MKGRIRHRVVDSESCKRTVQLNLLLCALGTLLWCEESDIGRSLYAHGLFHVSVPLKNLRQSALEKYISQPFPDLPIQIIHTHGLCIRAQKTGSVQPQHFLQAMPYLIIIWLFTCYRLE